MLLFDRRFGPLFVTQFLGAFNDNFLKAALLGMITYQLGYSSAAATALTHLAMGLFILPYFLFSGLAGQLADKFDKAPYCRWIKLWEVGLMLLAALAFPLRWVGGLFVLLFLMGTQSTFFSPAKYSLLPQQLRPEELVAGNALIEGGTYLAILLGMLGGSLTPGLPGGVWIAGSVLLVLALGGYAASWGIPAAPPPDRNLRLSFDPIAGSWRLLRTVWKAPTVRYTVLAVSLFWLVGALYVAQLTALCREVLRGTSQVLALELAVFSIGIGAGAWLCKKLLRGRISGRWVWLGAALMMPPTLDLYGLLRAAGAGSSPELLNLAQLAVDPLFYRVTGELLLVAIGGGMYSVPLQALMQHRAPEAETARVIAGNNLVNALYMAAGSVSVTALMRWGGFPSAGVMLLLLAVEAVMLVYSWWNRNLE